MKVGEEEWATGLKTGHIAQSPKPTWLTEHIQPSSSSGPGKGFKSAGILPDCGEGAALKPPQRSGGSKQGRASGSGYGQKSKSLLVAHSSGLLGWATHPPQTGFQLGLNQGFSHTEHLTFNHARQAPRRTPLHPCKAAQFKHQAQALAQCATGVGEGRGDASAPITSECVRNREWGSIRVSLSLFI